MGVAARLVTFLWPRKEKSLAKPRSGGETPSRTESSCPAWRSRANTLWQGKDVTQPLTLALSRKGRGDKGETPSRVQPSHLGAGVGVRLDAAKVATAPDCRYQIAPLTIDHEKGANRRRWISYGFIERLTMATITQLSETRGFLRWRTLFGLGVQSMAVGAGYWQGGGVTQQGEGLSP